MPSHPNLELSGKTAVVTGSSSGIGCAISLELASAGANVLVHCRQSREKAQRVVEEVRELGVQARCEMSDLAEVGSHEALVRRACDWKEIDIWINNAGADVLTGDAAGWSFDRKFEQLWKTDVTATVRLSRLIGAEMRRRHGGVIVNMGWDRAAIGMEGDSGEMFAAVKGAIMAFSRSLAKTLAPDVRVNCLAPGWIKTAWGEQASECWQQRAKKESLLQRWGTPQDVAQVCRFLVAASFVTGQIVNVNGGMIGESD